jgi:uncharacterized membrane protein YccF (DUF307 family)
MENHSFEYTYSAQRQQEVEEIRKAYLPKEEDKMEKLRKLHSIPTQKAQSSSIAVGVIGALILGTGMSLCMTDLGAALGRLAMIIGIIVGLVGMVLVALAYPVYNRVLKKQRKIIAPEILHLSDELLK